MDGRPIMRIDAAAASTYGVYVCVCAQLIMP